MAIDLLTLSKELLSLGSTLAKAQHDRRVAFANYLDKIADCVGKISQSARAGNNESRYALCAELEVYGRDCGAIISEMLDKERAEVISRKIEAATYTRRGMVFDAIILDEGRLIPLPLALKQLDEAAGHLRGMANTLRAPVAVFEHVIRVSSPREWLKRTWHLVIGKG
jgi:hypothetical protein